MSLVLFRRLTSALCLLAFAASFSGCTLIPEPKPDPTRYYVLTNPMAATTPETGANASNGAGLRIGLNAVDLASYLKGRAMVVRHGVNELTYNDYARWAEPLDVAITNQVRAQLLASPKIARVMKYPFPFDVERDCYVSIHVAQCEGAEPQAASGVYEARFVATIEIIAAGAEPKPITRRVFTAPATAWDGKDYSVLASALGEAVNALAQDVEAALPASRAGL